MKFVADENFAGPSLSVLREAGLNIVWVAESFPRTPDEQVLEYCMANQRTLLTFDKDFGELAYKQRLPATCGVILIRIVDQDYPAIGRRVLEVIRLRDSWAGVFATVTMDQVRFGPPLPKTD